jgi:selenocysteine-specific elongation factor
MRATKVEDEGLARFLETTGELVRLGPDHMIRAESFETAKEALVAECASAGEITLARFRDLLGIGRRDAQLLLERLDQDGVTRRVGDRRVLRRAATPSA